MIEIFKQFRNKYYDCLTNCNHPYSDENMYHLEGSVWAHTLLVFNSARLADASKTMQITALLHDVGKPLAEHKKNDRTYFTNHEHLSVVLSINFLLKLFELNKINIQELIDILYLIDYHGILWQKSEKQIKTYFDNKLVKMVKEFSVYDNKGNLFSDYSRKNEVDVEYVEDYFIDYDDNRPECIILVGVPNSGKSSYIFDKKYKKLSRDDILVEYGKDKYNIEKYSDIWKKLTDDDQKEIDKLLQNKYKEYVKNKENFIVDMTNLSIKSRRKWMHNLKNAYNIKTKVLLTDKKLIKKRNLERSKNEGKEIPYEVLINMAKNLELPLYKEGFCEINIVLNNKYEFTKEKE